MKTMQRICLRVNIEDEKSKRRMMKLTAGIEGVESLTVDTKERIITVIGDADPVSLCRVLRKNGFSPELLSVGPSREEETLGSNGDTENMGSNHYSGVQRAEAVGGFGGMNRAIKDKEGSEKSIVEVVAGFGDFTSIEVDIKKGMVTVVGKSVPVSVALKVREMGYRAKLLSIGPATEEEDTDEEHNDDSILYKDPIVEDVRTIFCRVHGVLVYLMLSGLILYVLYVLREYIDNKDVCTIVGFYVVFNVLFLYWSRMSDNIVGFYVVFNVLFLYWSRMSDTIIKFFFVLNFFILDAFPIEYYPHIPHLNLCVFITLIFLYFSPLDTIIKFCLFLSVFILYVFSFICLST